MKTPLDYESEPEREPPQYWVFLIVATVMVAIVFLMYWRFGATK